MKNLFLFAISFVIVLSSCKINPKDDDPAPSEEPSMEDMIISTDFDWKTTSDYVLTLKGNYNNIVEVISQDEKTIYQRAFLKAGVSFEMKLTLPSYEESILLQYMGNNVKLDLTTDNLSHDFE